MTANETLISIRATIQMYWLSEEKRLDRIHQILGEYRQLQKVEELLRLNQERLGEAVV
jgi:hypothetical protein